jgi:hypothetical protein
MWINPGSLYSQDIIYLLINISHDCYHINGDGEYISLNFENVATFMDKFFLP